MNRALIAVVVLTLACDAGEPMPQTLNTKIRGLWTSPNEHGETPAGALVRADDVVLTRDGIAEQRRGQPKRIAAPAAALIPYQDRLLVQSGSTLSISDAEVTSTTPFVGTFDPVTGRRMRGAEANGNLYVATASGVKRLDSADGELVDAGVPAGLDVDAIPTGGTGVLPANSAVAYRVVWGERDANGAVLLGPPSGRAVVTNANAEGSGIYVGVDVRTSVPPEATPGRHFWQVYRTQPSDGASIDPGEEMYLVYEGQIPATVTVTSLSRVSNIVTATTAVPHTFTGGEFVSVTLRDGGSGTSFAPGSRWLLYSGSTTELKYHEVGPDEVFVGPHEIEAVSVFASDTLPDGFSGATLYTSPSQEGALAAQYDPPIARDVEEFRGSLLLLGTTTRAALEVWLLAVDSSGASSGIRSGDTITVNGVAFTAGASEDVESRTFQRFTAGTPAQNVANTAASLVRVINRAQGSPVTCRDMASANETPGRLRLESRNRTDSIMVAVSRAGSWAFTNGQTAAPESHPNELRWSPKGKPDAHPLTAYQRIDGSGEGVRVLALRDSALVIMERGIYRASGDGLSATNAPTITPLDTTTEIVAPDTVVALDNLGFGLSSKGVVQISDQGGVTLLSRPIEDQIRPLLVEPMLSTVRTVAHGVANESEGKYYLWVPTSASDTQATKAFVYDHHASLAAGEPVWTIRTDDAACGIVHTDGRLYTGTSTEIRRERKDLAITDFADDEIAVTLPGDVTSNTVPLADVTGIAAGDVLHQNGVWGIVLSVDAARKELFLDRVGVFLAGAATVYKAIPTVVEWAPLIPAPGGAAHFQEATFLFRKLGGASMKAEFATEIVPTYTVVTFDGATMGINDDPAAVNLRTWIPRDQQRASRLKVRFSHAQAWSPMQLEGLSVIWSPTSIRVRR